MMNVKGLFSHVLLTECFVVLNLYFFLIEQHKIIEQ